MCVAFVVFVLMLCVLSGLVGSGKSFRKSLRKSQTIQEEEEEFTESSLKEQRRERDETEVEGE